MGNLKDFQIILDNFNDKVEDVKKLLILDDLILDTTVDILEERQDSLRKSGIENAHMLGENALLQVKNIRNNQSLKPGYKLIHNQCVVLLVSYFSSSMHDFFDTAATNVLRRDLPKKIRNHELKFTIEELKEYDFDLSKNIGSIISSKFDISFQDMGSITRAMKDYLGIEVPWDKRVNNIIAMQACRHAIAHAGEAADERLINQLRNSSERDIQQGLKVGDKVQFSPEEVKLGGEEMIKYFETISHNLLGSS
tara:strand:+ start:338 stop:1093 length:756 start_codon:yes stop_codon:yes gene_type:complete